jgi:hypothetical protein
VDAVFLFLTLGLAEVGLLRVRLGSQVGLYGGEE